MTKPRKPLTTASFKHFKKLAIETKKWCVSKNHHKWKKNNFSMKIFKKNSSASGANKFSVVRSAKMKMQV
jgi:hypothetical protein